MLRRFLQPVKHLFGGDNPPRPAACKSPTVFSCRGFFRQPSRSRLRLSPTLRFWFLLLSPCGRGIRGTVPSCVWFAGRVRCGGAGQGPHVPRAVDGADPHEARVPDSPEGGSCRAAGGGTGRRLGVRTGEGVLFLFVVVVVVYSVSLCVALPTAAFAPERNPPSLSRDHGILPVFGMRSCVYSWPSSTRRFSGDSCIHPTEHHGWTSKCKTAGRSSMRRTGRGTV